MIIAAVDQPLTDGPRPPDSTPAPAEQRVNGLIPFVHVRSVERSIAFYYHLGFVVTSIYTYRGTPAWAELSSDGAVLMVTTGDPVDQVGQGILFYLYSDDLAALREQLLAAGLDVGEIADGTPGPREEMELVDPDGYVLMIAQTEVAEGAARPLVTDVDVDEGWKADEETGGLVHMVRTSSSVQVGLWKPHGVADRRIEYELSADETLVVLRGSGELRVDEGEPIELQPGVVLSLSRGSRLSWLVDADFRELWIYS